MVEQLIRNEQVVSSILTVGSIRKTLGGGLTIRPLFLWIDNTSDNNRLENRFKSEHPDHISQTRLQLNIIFGWGFSVQDTLKTPIGANKWMSIEVLEDDLPPSSRTEPSEQPSPQ